ncbi:hypothetical protein TcasGA2_TC034372 [Tribolium castaneum]|uniref:Uncharacterized protein n=1 Tax=Tribolium castaneum TaxID=7070 RepID=A0A139WB88_TRICA|nr:hypothetical protein TcasGA2_TC034372 [Tribolium castaneum]
MKIVLLFFALLAVAFAREVEVVFEPAISIYLPPLNVKTEQILKSIANYACEPANCLPMMQNVCPFQFLCQLYCKEQQKEGACGGGACKCV